MGTYLTATDGSSGSGTAGGTFEGVVEIVVVVAKLKAGDGAGVDAGSLAACCKPGKKEDRSLILPNKKFLATQNA
jgi:hypothetical protein